MTRKKAKPSEDRITDLIKHELQGISSNSFPQSCPQPTGLPPPPTMNNLGDPLLWVMMQDSAARLSRNPLPVPKFTTPSLRNPMLPLTNIGIEIPRMTMMPTPNHLRLRFPAPVVRGPTTSNSKEQGEAGPDHDRPEKPARILDSRNFPLLGSCTQSQPYRSR